MNCNFGVELLPALDEMRTLPEGACPVERAKNVAEIARMNNCGKSVMCRDGMNQLYTIIEDITNDRAESEDIELLQDICKTIKRSEGCELASAAALLIDESISTHSDEWNAHIRRRRCSARVCEALAKNMPEVPQRPAGEDGGRRRKRKGAE